MPVKLPSESLVSDITITLQHFLDRAYDRRKQTGSDEDKEIVAILLDTILDLNPEFSRYDQIQLMKDRHDH